VAPRRLTVQHAPDPLTGFEGVLLLREEKGMGRRDGKGKGRKSKKGGKNYYTLFV